MIWTGGGISSLNIRTGVGDTYVKHSMLLGIGYSYFLSDNIAITSGSEFSSYNSTLKLNSLEGRYTTNDGMEDFEFQYRVYNYKESNNILFINIPLMLHYQTRGINRFYTTLGGKMGIPVKSNNKTSDSHIRTQGFYPQYGSGAILDAPAYHAGFGTFRPSEISNDLKFNVSYLISFEAGIKWDYHLPMFQLYTGLYVDYGLNDISNKNKEFLSYNSENPSNYKYNSALTSYYSQGATITYLIDKVAPIAIGVKIKLAFCK